MMITLSLRHSLLAVALAALPLTVTAQTMAPASDAPVTIRFYNYNLASAGLGREGTLEMLDTFAEANPHITVGGVPVPAADAQRRAQALVPR